MFKQKSVFFLAFLSSCGANHEDYYNNNSDLQSISISVPLRHFDVAKVSLQGDQDFEITIEDEGKKYFEISVPVGKYLVTFDIFKKDILLASASRFGCSTPEIDVKPGTNIFDLEICENQDLEDQNSSVIFRPDLVKKDYEPIKNFEYYCKRYSRQNETMKQSIDNILEHFEVDTCEKGEKKISEKFEGYSTLDMRNKNIDIDILRHYKNNVTGIYVNSLTNINNIREFKNLELIIIDDNVLHDLRPFIYLTNSKLKLTVYTPFTKVLFCPTDTINHEFNRMCETFN